MRNLVLMLCAVIMILCFGWSLHASTLAQNEAHFLNPAKHRQRFVEQDYPKFNTPPVSHILKTKKNGIHYEGLTKAQWSKLETQARWLVKAREDKLNGEEQAKLISECLAAPENNPFCPYLDANWRENLKRSKVVARPAKSSGKKITINQMKNALAEGDLSLTDDASSFVTYRALARLDAKKVQPAVDKTLNKWGCLSPKYLTALGLKMEEYFPDRKYRDWAIRFYQQSIKCDSGRDSSPAVSARYRLSLLYVWDDRCQDAYPHLDHLSSDPDGLFVSRAYYWRGRCARGASDHFTLEKMRNRIVKGNPLGFHTLSLNRDKAHRVIHLLHREEPRVLLRTSIRPDLNPPVRAIEMLNWLGENEIAEEIVEHVETKMRFTEPEFRIYFSALATKVGNHLVPFKVLSGVFYDRPGLVTDATLKVFFPVKWFNEMKKYKSSIDPYLIAALVRQESAFDPEAVSDAGAVGLMQLLPGYIAGVGRVRRKNLFNARKNVKYGVEYLTRLMKRFDGDIELALAGYNAGPNKIGGWLRRYPTKDRMLFVDLIPYSETRNYVALIARNYFWYRKLYAPEYLPNSDGAGNNRSVASEQKTVVFKSFKAY